MADRDTVYDVVIVGGGPAGAAAATILARKGRRVLVLEKEHFPRHHVGESLVLGVRGPLRALGVERQMEAVGFVRKHGSTHLWGNSFNVWDIYFNEEAPERTYSFQVERSVFDQVLISHAEHCGAEVRFGVAATDISFDDPDEVVVTYGAAGREDGTVRARFVVDASGQRRFLAQRSQLVEATFDPRLRNMAVYAYFSGSKLLPGPSSTNFLLEAYPNGWFWHIPLHTGVVSVGAVVGQDSLAELRSRGPDRFLEKQMEQTILTRDLLEDGEIQSRTRVINDGSYQVDRLLSGRFMLIGDAACFIDPMFAPGVMLALQTGVYGAMCIDFGLQHAERWPEVCALYEEEFRRAYTLSRHAVLLSYSSNDLFGDQPFWRERRLSDDQLAQMAADDVFMRSLQPTGGLAYERRSLDYSDVAPLIARELARLDREREERGVTLDSAIQDMGRWIPAWHPGANRRHRLGFPRLDTGFDLVDGLSVELHMVPSFVSDPAVRASFDCIDGRMSVRDILGHVLQRVPNGEKLGTQMRIVRGLVDGCQRGFLQSQIAA